MVGRGWRGSSRYRGTRSLDLLQGEVEDLVRLMASHQDQDFLMDTVFGIPVINILWTIVAGKRFHPSDPKANRLMHLLNRLDLHIPFLHRVVSNWGSGGG